MMMDATNGTKQATEEGKIFVGGLSWETTKDSLRAHFEQFGTVVESVVMTENATRKPRGFGFVTFADTASVKQVMEFCKGGQHHVIDNKQVDPKPAFVKGGPSDAVGCGPKIFVGGIGHDVEDKDVRAHFATYGTVVDVDLKVDKATNRKRGFAFVTFESEDAVDKVVQLHFHQLNGKTVECKRAQPRNQTQGSSKQQHPQQQWSATTPYGGYAQSYGSYAAPPYGQQTPQAYHQPQPPPPQPSQYPPHAGSYMNQGYPPPPQNTATGYPPMGRADIHNPQPPPQPGVHQGHMPSGYGRGHDTATASYHGAAAAPAVPQVGYGQSAAAGGAGAYGGGQNAYGYDMQQMGTPQAPPPHATASPYQQQPQQHTAYSDSTANPAYQGVGAAAPPPPPHKQPKTNYPASYY